MPMPMVDPILKMNAMPMVDTMFHKKTMAILDGSRIYHSGVRWSYDST